MNLRLSRFKKIINNNMENLNKALEDLLITLKEINKQNDEVIKFATEIKNQYADDYAEMIADQNVHVSGHVN